MYKRLILTKQRTFTQGQINQIRTLAKGTLSRKLEVETFIPERLLSATGKSFAKAYRAGGVPTQKNERTLRSDYDYVQAADFMTQQVRKFQQAYFAYYRALLIAMDGLLQNPNQPVKTRDVKQFKTGADGYTAAQKTVEFHRAVPLHLTELPGPAMTKQLTLQGTWPGLTEYTIDQKGKLGFRPTFWKHTQEASNAFHAAVTARLARLKSSDFAVKARTDFVLRQGSLGVSGPAKRVAKAKYQFQLGVPSWNDKFDTFITIPFASGRRVSTQTGTGVAYRTEKARRVRKLHGIDRILAAEAYRPWLRRLSIQAGQALQEYLKQGRASAPGSSPYAVGLQQQETAREKADHARAVKERAKAKQREKAAEARRKEQAAVQRAADRAKRAEEKKNAREKERQGDANRQKINSKVQADRARKEREQKALDDKVSAMVSKGSTLARGGSKTPLSPADRKAAIAKAARAKTKAPKRAREVARAAKPAAKPATMSPQAKDLQDRIAQLEQRTKAAIFNELRSQHFPNGTRMNFSQLDELNRLAENTYHFQVERPLSEAREALRQLTKRKKK